MVRYAEPEAAETQPATETSADTESSVQATETVRGETMMAKIADVDYYNGRRYGRPWACRVVDGENVFIRGAYDGTDGGGTVYIDNPETGQVYGVGQRDNRGGNSVTVYMMWDGVRFVLCDRDGNAVDADHYDEMLRRNMNVHPVTDIQVEPVAVAPATGNEATVTDAANGCNAIWDHAIRAAADASKLSALVMDSTPRDTDLYADAARLGVAARALRAHGADAATVDSVSALQARTDALAAQYVEYGNSSERASGSNTIYAPPLSPRLAESEQDAARIAEIGRLRVMAGLDTLPATATRTVYAYSDDEAIEIACGMLGLDHVGEDIDMDNGCYVVHIDTDGGTVALTMYAIPNGIMEPQSGLHQFYVVYVADEVRPYMQPVQRGLWTAYYDRRAHAYRVARAINDMWQPLYTNIEYTVGTYSTDYDAQATAVTYNDLGISDDMQELSEHNQLFCAAYAQYCRWYNLFAACDTVGANILSSIRTLWRQPWSGGHHRTSDEYNDAAEYLTAHTSPIVAEIVSRLSASNDHISDLHNLIITVVDYLGINPGLFEAADVEKPGAHDATYVTDADGHTIPYDAAVALMDDAIREDLHMQHAGGITPQQFFDLYAIAHSERYGAPFAV